MRWIAGIILAALWLSPVAIAFWAMPAAARDHVDLAPTIWADYQIYVENLGTGPAYYAVTEDGLGGAPSGCSLNKCLPNATGDTGVTAAEALDRCEAVSPPSRTCIIFAEGSDIVVDYDMRDY